MTYNTEVKNWFALYTKSRAEFKVAAALTAEGIDYYLPSVIKIRHWSDRKKKIEEPLLRGYVFIYATEKERLLSVEIPAVVKCLFDQGKPARIPEWQIESLKNILKNKTDIIVREGLVPGARVRIKEGPFENVIGVIREEDNENTIAVSINLLKRTVIAHIPKEISFELLRE